MPRNGSGTYVLPSGNPVISNTGISSVWANTTMTDIANALSNSIAKDGQTPVTTNIPMAGFKHINVGVASSATDYARADQVQDGAFNRCFNEVRAAGDAYSAQTLLGDSTFVNGEMIVLKFPATNTGTTPTLNVNNSANWSILREDGSAIVAGDCRANVPSRLMWNDTAWLLLGAVVSASSVAGVSTFNGRAGAVTLTAADITAAQAYVPVNVAGDTMLGPLTLQGNAAASLQAVPLQQVQALIAAIPSGGVTSFNGRTGAVTLIGTDIVTALGYTPASTNAPTFTGYVTGGSFKSGDGSAAAPGYTWANEPSMGFYRVNAGATDWATGGVLKVRLQSTYMVLAPVVTLTWAIDAAFSNIDVGVSRNAAGVVEVNSGTPGQYRDLRARYITANAFSQAAWFANTYAASMTFDYTNSQVQYVILSGNLTISAINNVPTGSIFRLVIGGTNAGTVTWPARIWWPNGVVPNLAAGPNKYAVVTIVNIGGADIGNASAH